MIRKNIKNSENIKSLFRKLIKNAPKNIEKINQIWY